MKRISTKKRFRRHGHRLGPCWFLLHLAQRACPDQVLQEVVECLRRRKSRNRRVSWFRKLISFPLKFSCLIFSCCASSVGVGLRNSYRNATRSLPIAWSKKLGGWSRTSKFNTHSEISVTSCDNVQKLTKFLPDLTSQKTEGLRQESHVRGQEEIRRSGMASSPARR
jgi:hypothetical protein